MLLSRTFALGSAAVWLVSAAANTCAGDLRIDGARLTVATPTLRAVFQGGEIAEITNRLTGERVAYGLQRKDPMTAMLNADGQPAPLKSDGWRRGRENREGRESAQTVLRDLTHTVWLNVMLDKETDDLVVATWGESSKAGVKGHRIALRSLDLTGGRLIVPTPGGLQYTRDDKRTEVSIRYPSEWLAQMLVWQCKEGGVVVYSRDVDNRFKGLSLSRRGDYADIALETHANGPWARQTSVPYVEWRINAYKGDWQVPASGYRALMNFARPRASPPEKRLWPSQVQRVESVPADAGTPWLERIAAEAPPGRTVLFLSDWNEGGPPDRRMSDNAARFIDAAHARGFYVMVSLNLHLARRDWPRFGALARHEARENGASGPPVGGPATMNPAARPWRAALIRELRDTFAGTRPDALFLENAAFAPNTADDDSGTGGLDGAVQLLEEVQAALPDMVLAADAVNEVILPHVRIAKRLPQDGSNSHPITEFLFGPSLVWF